MTEDQLYQSKKEPGQEIQDKPSPSPTPKPFPYWPSVASNEEMKRGEVMMELNKWAYNDPFVAKRTAQTLILLLADQFDINLIQLNP